MHQEDLRPSGVARHPWQMIQDSWVGFLLCKTGRQEVGVEKRPNRVPGSARPGAHRQLIPEEPVCHSDGTSRWAQPLFPVLAAFPRLT